MSLPHARRTRYRLLAWVVPSCFLAVVLRLVWLHWVDAPRLHATGLQGLRAQTRGVDPMQPDQP